MKLENFLLKEKDSINEIKLIDFGFAQNLTYNKVIECISGTPYFIAPEVLNSHDNQKKCDIWSVGVMMYIMISSKVPFPGNSPKEIL